jgi:pimeloyl-ACP methyl ester carboxylesterase
MLHQVVQHLRSGQFVFTDTALGAPHAQHVVLHGHSLGASIAQVEAATFDDVDGLVLMSWSDSGPSRLALDGATRQSATCLQGREYAPFAASAAAFRHGLFVTAPPRVQRVAARLRNPDPCGDVLSFAANQLTSGLTTSRVEPPVLLLFGSKDAYTRDGSARQQAQSYSAAESVTTHVVRGAGNALPLERSAPQTRHRVVDWLRSTLD